MSSSIRRLFRVRFFVTEEEFAADDGLLQSAIMHHAVKLAHKDQTGHLNAYLMSDTGSVDVSDIDVLYFPDVTPSCVLNTTLASITGFYPQKTRVYTYDIQTGGVAFIGDTEITKRLTDLSSSNSH